MKILKTLSKRGLALFLVLTMCVSLLPATAMAAEYEEATHTHNEDGWTCVEESELICGYEQEHTHDESCWETSEASGDPVCGLEESEGHRHDESCYTEETVLTCGQEESEEHQHDESCYTTETVLTCGQEETEGHTHGEECFAAGEKTLVCGLEEHQHGEECYKSVWTCTPPTAGIIRFLQAVKAIPEKITAQNVEEAETRIAAAIEAYQHLSGAEKTNASVVRAYDAILAAEIAVEAATEGTPETVLPEDAVVVDPADLVEFNDGIEEEALAVADLFTLVANAYLVDEEDPDVVSFPTTLYFVGEDVEEQFDIMDAIFPAEPEDEDALAEEPETVALTADAITWQDVPVTAYFLPEETATQDELLEMMGNDDQMFANEEVITLAIGESRKLTGSSNRYNSTQWTISSYYGDNYVSLTGEGGEATIVGKAAGTATVKYQGRNNYYGAWQDIDVYTITVSNSYAVYCYTFIPGATYDKGQAGSADKAWNGMGLGTVSGVNAPSTYSRETEISLSNQNISITYPLGYYPGSYPDITLGEKTYKYAQTSEQANQEGYYTIR